MANIRRNNTKGMTRKGLKLLLSLALLAAIMGSLDTLSVYGKSLPVKATSQSLQEIIDASIEHETITLKEGTYSGPVTITHALTLEGEVGKKVRIINESDQSAITILASNVTLRNLYIEDVQLKREATLVINAANQIELDHLEILTGSDAINITDSNQGIVKATTISWADEKVHLSNKGNGIELYNVQNWVIEQNVISNMHDGVYLEKAEDLTLRQNTIINSRYGLHLMFVSGGKVYENNGEGNVTGAMIMASNHIQLSDNTFAKQVGNINSQGILLYDTTDSLLTGNSIEGNRVGLYIEQSSENEMSQNVILNNFIGIQWQNSAHNKLSSNIIAGNVINVQSIGGEENTISENYWDSFSGIDINGDGYSETSYRINPLFYGITEKQPAFQLFFHSPGMDFLQTIYQSDASLWLTDRKPQVSVDEHSLSSNLVSASSLGDSIVISVFLLGLSTLFIIKARRKLK